ncbi:MAG: M20/M25/M40 family metallo-hydrolase [Gammaproteobacteria bacterium]|nr:M20/M25/M40 family metallo-hydrolase [Gammaproteobacteria bacterium]
MDRERLGRYVDEVWDDSVVPTLAEYIRIPNKSPQFEPDWAQLGHMQDAVEHLQRWVSGYGVRGLEHRIVALPGRTPVLLCDVAGSAPGNVLLYGHYDKQPEFDGWVDGLAPWEPVIRDGRLYGRGGADDGYAVFGSLAAIAALQDQGVPHPRCVVLIEGCEESGSFDLPYYMEALADEIGTPDLVICLDAECGNYDQLWLTTSLRGMLPGTLNVQVLTEGVHSGAAGGIVPSSFRLLRQLIERVENAVTGEFVDALAVSIPDWARQQAVDVAATLGDLAIERFPWAGATNPGDASTADLILANTWRSSLAVVGLGGAPALADAGNTLRPSTAAKLVFRLPPTLDAKTAGERVKALLEAHPPHGAQVSFDLEHPQTGWRAPDQAPWLTTAIDRASRDHFGAPLKTMGCGGTIPFMKMLGDRYPNVQFAVTGVLGPKSNAHGPNEFLDIATGKNVTACVAHLLGEMARQKNL